MKTCQSDIRRAAFAAAAVLIQAACSLAPSIRPAEIPVVSATTLPVPEAPPGAAHVLSVPGQGESIYRSPKIGVVYLAAHQDASGHLLGPQVMYQVVDPGGWNLGAAEQANGYIPIENLVTPPNLGPPLSVPAAEVPPLPRSAPLFDAASAARVTITGLMKAEDRIQAEAMAAREGPGVSAIFDDQAGWLLVPAN